MLIRCFLLCFLLSGPCSAAVWLAGVDPIVRAQMGDHDGDYDKFLANIPPVLVGKVAVFKTSTQYLMGASDDELRQMIAGLKRAHIDLAVELLAVPRTRQCGAGIEGYSGSGDVAKMAQRLKALGGDLKFAAMDEPLMGAHQASGPAACHDSIQEVAGEVAESVKVLREAFPDIQIGDIESIAHHGSPADWNEQIIAFAEAFRAATGVPLAFFHADIDWSRDWRLALADLKLRLQKAGIRFGVIYDGDPQDETDIAWTNHAEERFETVEADDALSPDDGVLQTWMLRPTHMLPVDPPEK